MIEYVTWGKARDNAVYEIDGQYGGPCRLDYYTTLRKGEYVKVRMRDGCRYADNSLGLQTKRVTVTVNNGKVYHSDCAVLIGTHVHPEFESATVKFDIPSKLLGMPDLRWLWIPQEDIKEVYEFDFLDNNSVLLFGVPRYYITTLFGGLVCHSKMSLSSEKNELFLVDRYGNLKTEGRAVKYLNALCVFKDEVAYLPDSKCWVKVFGAQDNHSYSVRVPTCINSYKDTVLYYPYKIDGTKLFKEI